jgi:hypothetical protein
MCYFCYNVLCCFNKERKQKELAMKNPFIPEQQILENIAIIMQCRGVSTTEDEQQRFDAMLLALFIRLIRIITIDELGGIQKLIRKIKQILDEDYPKITEPDLRQKIVTECINRFRRSTKPEFDDKYIHKVIKEVIRKLYKREGEE